MPANKPESSFAMLARERKAARLADTLAQHGITVADAESASESDWVLAAQVAGVNPPSKETCRIVIEMLKSKESPK